MRAFLLICLVALAFSYPAFFRKLQAAAPTTTTVPATVLNASQIAANFSLDSFDLEGAWTLQNTNCTDRATCVPTMSIVRNSTTQITLTVTFPTNTACGTNSGVVLNVVENVDLGMWYDTNASSPLYGFLSILRLNNMTSLVLRNDTGLNGISTNPSAANASGLSGDFVSGFNQINGLGNVLNGSTSHSICFEEWARPTSLVTNTTANAIPVARWAGVWELKSIVADSSVKQCCAPDVPPLIYDDEASSSVVIVYHLPNCTTCGPDSEGVWFTNISVAGGGGIDSEEQLFVYLMDSETAISVDTECAFVWKKMASGNCVNPANFSSNNSNLVATGSQNVSQIAANFSLQTFDLSGNWTLQNTNCTDRATCVPNVSIVTNSSSQITLTITFPNITACGNNSGEVVIATENVDLGMWYDTNATSPLYGWVSILRLNNLTSLVLRNDTGVNGFSLNPNATSDVGGNFVSGFTPIIGLGSVLNGSTSNSICFEEWARPTSLVTNTTANALPVANWMGAWELKSIVADPSVTSCCIPDVPPLVYDDEASSSVVIVWHNPNCTACGTDSEQVTFANVTVGGGGGIDADDEIFFYLMDSETVITVDTDCALVWKKMIPIQQCVNPANFTTATNATNATTGGGR